MHDSQKKGMGASSGGRRIDDHSFWAGKPGKDSRFPDGPHKTKDESSAEGAGSLKRYEDSTEAIRKVQSEGSSKAKAHQGRLPEYRN